jgi:hypothetical protein
MEKAGDDFIKSLSEKLPEFFKSFSECWMMDRIINHKDEKLGNDAFLCWYLMQNIAKKKLNLLQSNYQKKQRNNLTAILMKPKRKLMNLSKR